MNKLFDAVFSLRYVAILAVIAPFFGALLMLLIGTQNTIEAYLRYFGVTESEGALNGDEAAMIELVASIDHFLFAAILMIFAIGLYALFFRSTTSHKHASGDGEADTKHSRALSWKHLKNMGGMDEMLLKVIIMLLAVSFLEFTLISGIEAVTWTSLVIPAAIITLAIALKLMSSAEAEEESKPKQE
jgi:uncharacterized membrane protein YqhA